MKNFITILLILILSLGAVLGFTGCNSSQAPANENSDSPALTDTDNAPQPLKVALLLSGPITDQGWNAMAYGGIVAIEEDHGADISYTENVPQSDMEEVFRGYAQTGYDVVFGHGFEFQDAAIRVAEEFPETIFILTSNNYFAEPNMGSVSDDGLAKGFMAGVVAGVVSESGLVGFIGGMEIPPIRLGMDGFAAGAQYANPDIEVLTSFVGNFEDAGAAKEIALAMIDSGADLVMAQADSASLGVIEAVRERNIYGIGINADQSSLAPDNILTSSMAKYNVAMSLVVGDIISGNWTPSAQALGLREGVVDLAPYHDQITDEQIARIEEIKADIIAGNIDIRDL